MAPVRIAVADPHELIVAGLTHVLSDPGGPYHVVSLGPGEAEPDVILYTVDRGGAPGHDSDLHRLLRTTASTVIALYWDESSPTVAAALSCGVQGAVGKQWSAKALVAEIDRIVAGGAAAPAPASEEWCDPEVVESGLTPREIDVLGLIAAGLSNQEIADRLYLSINSVKTYVRAAYQRIGVVRRSQAVVWAERHGLTQPVGPSVEDDDHAVGQ